MKKRILSLILAIAMILSLCCFTVGAEDGEGYADEGEADWGDVQVLSVNKTDDKTFIVTFGRAVEITDDKVQIKVIGEDDAEIDSTYVLDASSTKLTITAVDVVGDNYAIVICDADEDDYAADDYVNGFTPALTANATVGGKDAFYAPSRIRDPESNIYVEPVASDVITIARAQRVDATHYTLAFSEPVNLAYQNVKVYKDGDVVATATDAKYIGTKAAFENDKWYSDFINITFDNAVPETGYVLKISDTADSKDGFFDAEVLSGIEKKVKTTSLVGQDEIALGSPDMEPGYTTLHTVHDVKQWDTYVDNTTPTTPTPYTHPAVNWPTKESDPDNAVQILYAKVISKTQLEVKFSEPVRKADPFNAWISIRYTNTSHGLQQDIYLKDGTTNSYLQEGVSGAAKAGGDGSVWIFNYSDGSSPFYGNNLYEVALCKGFESKNYVPTFCIEDNRSKGDTVNDRIDCFVAVADETKYLAANNCNTNANEDYYVPITIDEASKVIPEPKFTNFEQGLEGVTIEKVELYTSTQLLITFSEAVTLHNSGIYTGVRYTTIGTDGNFALHNHKVLGNLQSSGSIVLVDEDTLTSYDLSGTKVTESSKAIFNFTSFPGGRNLVETLNLKGFEFSGYTPLFDIEENGTATQKGYVEAIESVANPGTYLLANYVKSAGAWEDCYFPITPMEEEKPFADTQDLKLLGAEYFDANHLKLTFSEKIQFLDSTYYTLKDNVPQKGSNGKVFIGLRYCDVSSGKPDLLYVNNGTTPCQPALANETDLLYIGDDAEGNAIYLAALNGLETALKGNVYAGSGVLSPELYFCIEGFPYRNRDFVSVNNRVGYIDGIISEADYDGKYKKLLATNGKQNNSGGYDGVYVPVTMPSTAAPISAESAKVSLVEKTISLEFKNNIEVDTTIVAKLTIGDTELNSTSYDVKGNVLTFTFGDDILKFNEELACKLEIPADKVEDAVTGGKLVALDSDGNFAVVNKTFKKNSPYANLYKVLFDFVPVTIKNVTLTPSAYELAYTIEFTEPMHIYDPNCIHVTFNQDPQGAKVSAGTTDQLDLIDYKGAASSDGVNALDDWNKGSVVYENDDDGDGFATRITFKFENKLLYTYQSTDDSPFAFYPENAGVRFEEWRGDFNNGNTKGSYFGDGLICKESIRSLSGNSLAANCQNTNGCDVVWLPTQYWIDHFADAQSFRIYQEASNDNEEDKYARFGDDLEYTITDAGWTAYKSYFDDAENYKIQVAGVTPALEKAVVIGDKAVLLFNRPTTLDGDYEALEVAADGKSKLFLTSADDELLEGFENVLTGTDAKLDGKTATMAFFGTENVVAYDEDGVLQDGTSEFVFKKLSDGTYTIGIEVEEEVLYIGMDEFSNGSFIATLTDDAPSYYIVNVGTTDEPVYQIYSKDLTKVYYYDTTLSYKNSIYSEKNVLKTTLIGRELEETAVTLVITSAPTPVVLWGDANGDGYVDITDTTAIIANILYSTELVGGIAADANGDGYVDITDTTAIIANILYSTPLGPQD